MMRLATMDGSSSLSVDAITWMSRNLRSLIMATSFSVYCCDSNSFTVNGNILYSDISRLAGWPTASIPQKIIVVSARTGKVVDFVTHSSAFEVADLAYHYRYKSVCGKFGLDIKHL